MIYIYLPRIDESGLARGLKYCRNWCLMVQRYKNYQTLCIVSSFRWDYFLDAKFHQLFLLSYSRFLAMCSAQVDLVTMLEKAISYVKFLQLQVKVKTKNNITSFPLKTIELSWSISLHLFSDAGVGNRWILAGPRWESTWYIPGKGSHWCHPFISERQEFQLKLKVINAL